MTAPPPVASYVIRTFPKRSESFVVRELLALQQAGVPVEIWSLLPAGEEGWASVPEAAPLRPLVREIPAARSRDGARELASGLAAAARRPLRLARAAAWAAWWALRERDPRHLAALPYAAAVARRGAAPHLHAHFANTPATTAVLAAMLSGRTASYTGHARDLWVATSPAFLGAKTEHCAFAVSGTQFALDRIRAACRPGRAPQLEVVTNAVALPEGARGRPEPGLVVCTARLVEKKGLDTLVRAVALLAATHPEVRLKLIGEGPERGKLEGLVAELGVGSRVELRGGLPFAEVAATLERASVFALPAREARDGDTDGLPVAILEAMAHGVPVVATPIAGIPEAVLDGRTGTLVPPDDPQATATAIGALLSDPARAARLGRAGRALVAKRHDAATSAATLARLFAEARR